MHILCFGPISLPFTKTIISAFCPSLLYFQLLSLVDTPTIFFFCIKNVPSTSLPLKAPPDHHVLLNHSPLSFPLHNQPPPEYFWHSPLLSDFQSHKHPLPRLPLVAMYPLKSLLHIVGRGILLKYSRKPDLFHCPPTTVCRGLNCGPPKDMLTLNLRTLFEIKFFAYAIRVGS